MGAAAPARIRHRHAALPACGGDLTIIAAILEQPVIEKIRTHLGLQARAPPRALARGQALQAARRCPFVIASVDGGDELGVHRADDLFVGSYPHAPARRRLITPQQEC
jgi:hypothetical protein